MNTRKLIGIVSATFVVVSCGGGGGGGGGGVAAVPVASFDAPPFLPENVEVQALSSSRTEGVSEITVSVTAGSDGSLLFELPGGETLTLTNAQISSVDRWPDGSLANIFYRGGAADVDVLIGRDSITEEDTYMLARVDLLNTSFGFETHAIFGDYTSTPLQGTANYAGTVIASLFVDGEVRILEDDYITGDSSIAVDFDTAKVDVSFTNLVRPDGVGINGSLSGTGLDVTGAVYQGAIGGLVVGYDLDGQLIGGFFGPDAGATAGVFDVEDATGFVEIVGGYDGDKLP